MQAAKRVAQIVMQAAAQAQALLLQMGVELQRRDPVKDVRKADGVEPTHVIEGKDGLLVREGIVAET